VLPLCRVRRSEPNIPQVASLEEKNPGGRRKSEASPALKKKARREGGLTAEPQQGPSEPCGARSTVQTIPPSQRPAHAAFCSLEYHCDGLRVRHFFGGDGNFTQLSGVRTTAGTGSRRPFLVLFAMSEILPDLGAFRSTSEPRHARAPALAHAARRGRTPPGDSDLE
jgi:hypothetical protein